jgi:hypothetical protein
VSEASYRRRLHQRRAPSYASASGRNASEADDEQDDDGESAICRFVVKFSGIHTEFPNAKISPSCTKRRSSQSGDGKTCTRLSVFADVPIFSADSESDSESGLEHDRTRKCILYLICGERSSHPLSPNNEAGLLGCFSQNQSNQSKAD